MDPRTRTLLEAPIGPTLLRLSLPNVVVMVMQSSIGLTETYFVGWLGTDALAGMSLVFPTLMLFQMISAGAMGGGILSAVARTLGSDRRADAGILAWYAVAIALGLGVATTILMFAIDRPLYSAMGGHDASLAAALTYATIVFAGAVPLWLYNSLAAVIRGTGNIFLPAAVTAVGAIILIPISPALIFGWGPLPAFGIAGGAIAIVTFYVTGTVIFATYLWTGRGVIHPTARPPRLRWAPLREILRVGAISSLINVTTNIVIVTTTGFVGAFGAAAVAGYGTGSRLEYLLVPLAFGFGGPLAAMVGTSIGAGQRARALKVTWIGASITFAMTEAIGLAGAFFPHAWLGLFGSDPAMLEMGTKYLHSVGPFYGFFGGGLALYFASQGAGRLAWPLLAAAIRVTIALGGGIFALRVAGGIDGVFLAVGIALAASGLINAAAIAAGVWFDRAPVQAVPATR
jgi:putative MATE family efflux protein